MAERERDAYMLACVELEAASQALEGAEARVRAARAECERLEAALEMTRLSDGIFPELGCAAPEQQQPDTSVGRKRAGRG